MSRRHNAKRASKVTVYLIHFEVRYKHAGHYLGSALNLEERLAQHLKNEGARLLEVVNDAGIKWRVVRTWEGTRATEAKFKRAKHNVRLCPICQP
jgi:predicted GIY-YIG superfamily endonuclease